MSFKAVDLGEKKTFKSKGGKENLNRKVVVKESPPPKAFRHDQTRSSANSSLLRDCLSESHVKPPFSVGFPVGASAPELSKNL